MKLAQYGDYLYLYILLLSFIPAIVLGVKEKNIKPYGVLVSIFMVGLIIGTGKYNLILFIMFIIGEFIVVYGYLFIRKKTDNKIIYYLVLLSSMLPVIITKASVFVSFGPIGFIGLSYLNFKAIQMIIEIYDGAIKEVKFSTLVYFLLFFPTLSSGPIDRFRRFEEDLNKKIDKNEYLDDYLYIGLRKIIIGLGYKFVIAYIINTMWMSKIPADITFINGLNYMYAYSLYLFFDFAGYSSFAVGTSYVLGIKTPDNFNKPFLSKDMKEFWTRWHISLSKWFGDYLYSRIVLNSMRKKRFKSRFTASHVAQMITMFVMGIWHGLSLFYIIYGLYQGGVLVATDIIQRKWKFYKKHKKEKWFQYTQIVINFNVACFGLFLFSGWLFR
ncbi:MULTISPECIES: D-alanyl-lipoteichoic acid biosynthesis protein DltB [Clostridium]|uniref:D-alanyl-lipoteichoic acid biosynthesis protein DltB n=1 Tax=Clostridium TaxID=1485 RepID=UPI000C088EC2|nr:MULTISPECIES: D-alanyl-lipoteichoic acid biosynthesis protein DltB [Clostridium]MBU6134261.1 D-alanyl-lipoteichoic acid biosynthesis protein DltB [Clostridium tertium]MDB1934450.1 D-alanyl-lipoteichoic acid biosynthesis protein DltB [Clostridium tertium]MDB1937686.1 D-alanyl-lipoteichoic acid biosynthesis protein DltB [Clostridium tertium]MDB1953777.1 D-alanyl-lipoteichoic acid biosynthesis protein DltB [Clostridium tertium]MDB1959542.1 D-alanyl-lipoteichoic acid biosynthesis protein DltB [